MFASDSDQPTPINSADDLLDKHQELLDDDNAWLAIWDLFSNHGFFRSTLNRCAVRALRRTNSPPGWVDDIQQEALIRIGRQLQKAPDLGFDPTKGKYSTWLYRCTLFACLKASTVFREKRRIARDVNEDDRVINPIGEDVLRADLRDAIETLPKKDRDMIVQFSSGASIEQIAQTCKYSVRTVYRRLHDSIEFLKRQLDQ